MERSFANEIESLKLGDGEGILAVTRALLQSGVSCVGGYQGAPLSHLIDVMVEAAPQMAELGVHVELGANGASAVAMADERHTVLDTALRGEDASGGVPVAFTPLRGELANVH